MSVKLTFWKKVRLFRRYLNHQKNGVLVTCGICNSSNIEFSYQGEKERCQEGHKVVIYKSDYKCNDCSASCKNVQGWVKKID
ncbi:hypothetical protein CHH51_01340 [Terribacillus saccharophilus]|nr:hypothetical protein CHH51_01340 [Terribacillus saccharophilus]